MPLDWELYKAIITAAWATFNLDFTNKFFHIDEQQVHKQDSSGWSL